jgi:transcriptional regulator with XRE-family HTH domain
VSTSGSLIREARLRAGLSQAELGEVTGKDRAQIARWERDAVSPPFETLRVLLRACGYDLAADLVPHDESKTVATAPYRELTPSERVATMLSERETAR